MMKMAFVTIYWLSLIHIYLGKVLLFRLLIGKLRILHTALSAADLNMTAIHVARGIRGQKHQYLSQVLRRTEAAARDVRQQRITVLLNTLRSDLCCDHTRHIGQHPDIGCLLYTSPIEKRPENRVYIPYIHKEGDTNKE